MKEPVVINSFSLPGVMSAFDQAMEEDRDVVFRVISPCHCDVYSYLGIFDYVSRTKDILEGEVRFECLGLMDCLQLLIMLAIDKDKRRVSEYAQLLFEEYEGWTYGTVDEIKIEIEAADDTRKRVREIIEDATDIDSDELEEFMKESRYFFQKDIIAFGIVED